MNGIEIVRGRVGLDVDGDDVGTGLTEALGVADGPVDHQVDVKDQRRRRADGGNDRKTKGNIGNKLTVHNVNMNIFSMCFLNAGDVSGERAKVGRQNGRGYTDHESTSGIKSANRRIAGGIK